MARVSSPSADPAAEAAGLLRRVGFATLFLVVPSAALVTRRGLVILVPIGVALLALAAALDGAHRPAMSSGRRIAASPAGIAALVVLLWCGLSLIWTPFPEQGAERLVNIVVTIVLAVAGYLALPDRMRSANLYLVPVGVGAATALSLGVSIFGVPGSRTPEVVAQNLDRGLTVLAMLVWPAVAWLRSRGRNLEAVAVGILVAVATFSGPQPLPVTAVVAGALAYAVVALTGQKGVRIVAYGTAGLLALAPLIPFLVRPVTGLLLDRTGQAAIKLRIWRSVVLGEPERLVTGHGFETALRGRLEGLLPMNAPNTLLFEVWYELGIVGALAGAFALFAAITAAGRTSPSLAPGIVAAFVAAYALACLGIGTAQLWWFTALALVVLVFVAIERGQFRTTRPKAQILHAANEP
jgi:hypothetical protein